MSKNMRPDETSVDALRPGMSLNFPIIAAARAKMIVSLVIAAVLSDRKRRAHALVGLDNGMAYFTAKSLMPIHWLDKVIYEDGECTIYHGKGQLRKKLASGICQIRAMS